MDMHPIYVVITQRAPSSDQLSQRYGLPNNILRVISCDASEIEEVYNRYVIPLTNTYSFGIQVHYFTREPENALKEQAETWNR